jgi:hypothetical protein
VDSRSLSPFEPAPEKLRHRGLSGGAGCADRHEEEVGGPRQAEAELRLADLLGRGVSQTGASWQTGQATQKTCCRVSRHNRVKLE